MVSGRQTDTDCSLGEQPCFENPKDEALYWKEIAEEYIQKLQDVRDEFDEFQQGSRELEVELEAQLEQYEQRVKDLVNTKTVLEDENEMLKEKLESIQRETYVQLTSLQDENSQIKAVKEEMTKYIREVEQTNDDLERAKRATICSLEEFDSRLNSAIERNAFLENELEEKEELIVTVQRLKDEARELKGDLALSSKQRHTSLSESKSKVTEAENQVDNSTKAREPITPKKKDSVELEKNKTNTIMSLNTAGTPLNTFRRSNSNTMTPSARISALNIVSDLLRKVGALESKLASCRNFVQEHPRNGKMQNGVHVTPLHGVAPLHGVTPIIDSPKSKQKTLSSNSKSSTTNNISGLVKVNV